MNPLMHEYMVQTEFRDGVRSGYRAPGPGLRIGRGVAALTAVMGRLAGRRRPVVGPALAACCGKTARAVACAGPACACVCHSA